MPDPVIEALRELAPVSRGRVSGRVSGHAVHLHRPALVAEAILACGQ